MDVLDQHVMAILLAVLSHKDTVQATAALDHTNAPQKPNV